MDTQTGDIGPQYLSSTIVNTLSFVYGLTIGWAAPMQPLLQSNSSLVEEHSFWDTGVRDLSNEGMSWIGGTACIGGIVGTPLFGYLAGAVGRKMSLILAGLPFVVAYILLALANDITYVYIARILTGLGGAGALCIVPMYVGETVEDHVRGVLSSFLNLFICVGILTAYVIGSYTSYMHLVLFTLGWAIVFLVFVMWLPESPVYSIINDRSDEATKTLTKLRGNHHDLVESQINGLSRTVKEMVSNNSNGMSFFDMIRDPATRNALFLTLTIMSIQQASGVSPIINYTVAIFEASGSQLSPSLAAIIVGALQILGALLGTLLMDKAGRKLLLMISGTGMTLTLSPIAYYFYLKLHGANEELLLSIGWLPVTCLAIYIIVYGMGFGPVPYVLVSELFKTEAKAKATSICMFHLWSIAFIFLKFFSNVSDALGIDMCFAFFAACCGGGVFFIYFKVMETKGKSLECILEQLGEQPKLALKSSHAFLKEHNGISQDKGKE